MSDSPTTPPATIRRSDKAARALGFERLLAQGLQRLQEASGRLWTDHNLHDPGITVLEQLCFALTELAYRADQPVQDHLAGPDGRIDLAALALHPPEQALPCRATTGEDYRRLLLDRVPGLDDAHLQPAAPGTAVAGVYRLQLKVASGAHFSPQAWDEEAEARARRREALRAYRAERNLCEDLDPEGEPVLSRWCSLHGDVEIAGPREPAEIVADIYDCAMRWIDRSPRRLARGERLKQRTMDQVYDGPVTLVGFVPDEGPDDHRQTRLYLADLVRDVRKVEGIKEVHDLALATARSAGGRPEAAQYGPPSHGSVAWTGADWALRLHIPRAGDTPHVKLRRRALEVALPAADELWRRVRNLRVADIAQRTRLQSNLRKEEEEARPRGTYRPPSAHLSVQHDFPALYALGRHALPASASAQHKARVKQLRAYLLMFDQLLANGDAQLHHLRDLFAVRGVRPSGAGSGASRGEAPPAAADALVQPGDDIVPAGRQTYWWQALEADGVPGLDELLTQPAAQIAREACAFFDRSSARKSRLLDHLLALHGETLTQNSLRQYCGHLRADELDRALLDNKARFLEDIVDLSRARAGAFDDSRPLWGNPANFSGLARRMCLLLGFRHDDARSLTRSLGQALQRAGVTLVEGEVPARPDAPRSASEVMVNVVDALARAAGPADTGPDPLRWLAQGAPHLPAALFRAGAAHDRYRMRTLPARDSQGARTSVAVVAGGDRAWTLDAVDTRETARLAAARLRRTLIELNESCEGLHLVEHVLLRPLRARSYEHERLAPLGQFAYGLQLSVVMPSWTVRTHQPAFRQLAEETLHLNLPVHLTANRIVWLDYARMTRFEQVFRRWLVLRRRWCRAPTPARARRADLAACEVIPWLLRRQPRTPEGERD